MIEEERYQQVTRLPYYPNGGHTDAIRPGHWIVPLKSHEGKCKPECLCEKPVEVKSLTCAITDPKQKRAAWRLILMDGRSLLWGPRLVRRATAKEVERAKLRQ